jgi:hypothetical protein
MNIATGTALRTLAAAALAATALGVAARPAAAAGPLCVGPKAGCFAQLQPAIDAAQDGDTITIAAGTFAGGITIDKSIHIEGTGATETIIQGGGPVVTIFRPSAPDALNVSIEGVTITGGVNNTQPDAEVTFGGGIWIPTSQLDHPPFNGTGATVSISNSSITGNTVRSNSFIPPQTFCGPRACGFNSGGGIDNGGVLTLTNTSVTNNTVGSTTSLVSVASDADAGGIDNRFASTLVLLHSVVSGNRAVVNSPIANGAGSGGIGGDGALTIEDSAVDDNVVEYTGSMDFEDQSARNGGIGFGECHVCDPRPPVSIRNTEVSGNRVTAVNTNTNSMPAAFAGGIGVGAPALLDHVTVTDNVVQIIGAGFAGADGGGIEVDAPVTMRDSKVLRNSVSAKGPLGAIAFGGGIAMFGADLTLERTLVIGNSVEASGAAAPLPFGGVSSVFGGGVSNNTFGGPPTTLTLVDSVINANRLSASPGFLIGGGGVFTESSIVRTRTVIAGNKPDDCFGC